VTPEAEVGVAAFAVGPDGARWCEVQAGLLSRGASVVKPLLFWAGAAEPPFVAGSASWAELAEPAVVVSDNDATAVLWSRVGGDRLLAGVEGRTGIRWRCDPAGGEHEALRVLVTADELARAYAAFVADDAGPAARLRAWMRAVPPAQAFGVREVACDVFGVPHRSVGVKCGWFGLERVHAVTIVELPDRTVGAAVTTVLLQGDATELTSLAAVDPAAGIVGAHAEVAGPLVCSGTRRGLETAGAL
jgi:hypothetical protein